MIRNGINIVVHLCNSKIQDDGRVMHVNGLYILCIYVSRLNKVSEVSLINYTYALRLLASSILPKVNKIFCTQTTSSKAT